MCWKTNQSTFSRRVWLNNYPDNPESSELRAVMIEVSSRNEWKQNR